MHYMVRPQCVACQRLGRCSSSIVMGRALSCYTILVLVSSLHTPVYSCWASRSTEQTFLLGSLIMVRYLASPWSKPVLLKSPASHLVVQISLAAPQASASSPPELLLFFMSGLREAAPCHDRAGRL